MEVLKARELAGVDASAAIKGKEAPEEALREAKQKHLQ